MTRTYWKRLSSCPSNRDAVLGDLKNEGEQLMSSLVIARNSGRKRTPPLVYFLGFVSALFIGILIFAYTVTKQTNPVFLDSTGKPLPSSSATTHAGH